MVGTRKFSTEIDSQELEIKEMELGLIICVVWKIGEGMQWRRRCCTAILIQPDWPDFWFLYKIQKNLDKEFFFF